MLERVTADDMRAIVGALVKKAKPGDVAATKLLLDRVLGRVAGCRIVRSLTALTRVHRSSLPASDVGGESV